MSAKWIRSKQWDDQNIPTWAWPLKVLLRTFSGIPLAVVLLSLIVVYAILASVPIGLLTLGLTYILYGLTLLLAIGAALILILILRALWRPSAPRGRTARFVATVLGSLLLIAVAAEAWYLLAWPRLIYDPAHGTGLRLFAGFVDQYKSTTLRRLPGVEMSELEFYSWWPLRVVLLLFVVNMITATVRRIEFAFPNIGVLTVHTGIVVIALGSIYYAGLKLEGDTILLASEPDAEGNPGIGPPQQYFYDNTHTVLWAKQGGVAWEQRAIRPPRYNDYNLLAGADASASERAGRLPAKSRGPLNQPALAPRGASGQGIDPDIQLRVIGYASYANPSMDWARREGPAGGPANPIRFIELFASLEDAATRDARAVFYFAPRVPAGRVSEIESLGIEYTRGMDAQRWADLGAELPQGATHALVIETAGPDGTPHREIIPASTGDEVEIGQTGYRVLVQDVMAQPPFPIITPGYENARSSVAVVRITTPRGEAFDRWVYHRFPEISQDMLDQPIAHGMPTRRPADPSIRVAYIDASKIQVYLDESGDAETTRVRAIVRTPGGPARIIESVDGGEIRDLIVGLSLRLAERWPHATAMERPSPVPEQQRRNDSIGNHQNAMLAVEVTAGDGTREIVWLPFTRYLGMGMHTERKVRLRDGRELTLAFGRRAHLLPGFAVQLVDFQMLAYDHRGAPRDYQSTVRVLPVPVEGRVRLAEPFIHVTKLNAPLQAPFMWNDDRAWMTNMAGLLRSRLNPEQFKFSQSGWDQQGWAETQAQVDQGILRRPFASFTILGVGNNPGIHIIALGAILMSVGIPWAFYVKPWIIRRRKARIAAQVAAGAFRPTPSRPTPSPSLAETAP
jgi:hypothetical protein